MSDFLGEYMKGVFRLALLGATGIASLAPAAPAQATTYNYCVDGTPIVCLYYHGNGTGARAPFGGNIPVFTSNYVFWDTYLSTSGYNQPVRNDTAYLYNNDPNHDVAEFVYPNYAGASDLFDCNGIAGGSGFPGNPGGWWYGNLDYTWNNNASENDSYGCI